MAQYLVVLGPVRTAEGSLNEGATIELPEEQAESWLKVGILRAVEPVCEMPPVEVKPEEITGDPTPESGTPAPTEHTRKRGK